jgi:hypothetical protein
MRKFENVQILKFNYSKISSIGYLAIGYLATWLLATWLLGYLAIGYLVIRLIRKDSYFVI